MVSAISSVTEQKPVLVLARQIALHTYRQVDSFRNIGAVQKPYSTPLIQALLQKACSGEAFKPATCPRFITDHPVRLMILRNGHIVPTRMRNYSSGGVFLEYRGISVAVGDQVAIMLQEIDGVAVRQSLQLFARVAWVRDGRSTTDSLCGVGLRSCNLSRA